MFRAGRVGVEELRGIAERARSTAPTYGPVGGSLTGATPAGFRPVSHAVALPGGARPDVFDVAVDGLRRWAPHRHAGLLVVPSAPPALGATVAVAAPVVPGVTAIAVCRVVAVVDEPDRWGFAYGTLPGHPECGEEAFVVERERDPAHEGGVVFRVTAFSRPAELVARLGGPVTHLVQRRTTRRYLDGLVAFVAGGGVR